MHSRFHNDLLGKSLPRLSIGAGSYESSGSSLVQSGGYGLGTENQNLPGFITISPPPGVGGSVNNGSAFLPASFRATRIGSNKQPIATAQVANLKSPRPATLQQEQLQLIRSMNYSAQQRDLENPFLDGFMEAHELAYRMQGELPEVTDLAKNLRIQTHSMVSIAPRQPTSVGSA